MLIITNYWASFPKTWTASTGLSGTSVTEAYTLGECLKYRDRQDAVFLINCNPKLLYQLAAVFSFMPGQHRPLVSVDLVLRRPYRALDYVSVHVKRFLLRRVDHHILFFKDLSGYKKYYGIGPDRSSFVPFKASLPIAPYSAAMSDGEYVLCYGRSQRDWNTFFDAMKWVPYPGATSPLSLPEKLLERRNQWPENLRLLEDENTPEAQVRILSSAKLVILPILRSNVAASGLSVCFNAMGLGKCVIGSEGPAFTDMFSDQVLLVPPGDAKALAEMIRRAWEDDELRRTTAKRGYEYAVKAGGRDELYQRVIDALGQWLQSRELSNTR